MDQSKELYWEVVRLHKEGYSYRKIEALLKDRFGISYREIGYLINAYEAAREAEGDFYEAEIKAREIIEEAEREAMEKEERTEKKLEEKRKELQELDEMSRGARNAVELKMKEFREITSSVDSLIVQKRMLTQSVDSKGRAKDFLEEKNHSLQYAYNTLNKRFTELTDITNLLTTQKIPLILSSIFTSLTTNQIANLLTSLPEEKLMEVIELLKRKKGFTPSPIPTGLILRVCLSCNITAYFDLTSVQQVFTF